MNRNEELYNELMGIWSSPDCVSRDITLQILRECKKAGLIFNHDCENCPKREEDGYGLICVIRCSEPFEEIDIGDGTEDN